MSPRCTACAGRPGKPKRLLDLCCGTGSVGQVYREEGFLVTSGGPFNSMEADDIGRRARMGLQVLFRARRLPYGGDQSPLARNTVQP
jgi:hypothetical protein